MRHIIIAFIVCLFFTSLYAQKTPVPTSSADRLKGYEQRLRLQKNSLVANVPFRSVGPTIMSGRVTDIDVSPTDASTFFVAFASGGLWITHNNGQSFEPLFDNQAAMTIGDIAVDWAHGGTIWVGTGECNSSRSSYAGTGVYKSLDTGKTWQYCGLPESHHISRLIIHPTNPDIIWVAVIGHLYSANKERGVYKTTDGGKTWKQTLFVDDNTGIIDLVINPKEPNTMMAASWHRQRRAWDFVESGTSSGIYKSTDGGDTWTLISGAKSNFPQGEGIGRIGLAFSYQNPKVAYAFVDNQSLRPKETDTTKKAVKLTKDQLRTISKNDFLALADSLVDNFLEDNDFPRKYDARKVKKMVEDAKITPQALVEYLEDANSQLFDTPIVGAQVYRTDDGGATWSKTHDGWLDEVVYTYGYYFGQIRTSPHSDNTLYITGVPLIKSVDGGKNFTFIGGDNVHVDNHVIWENPNRAGHLINGNDGGINISYDGGTNWSRVHSPAVGQFYTVQVDMTEPYNVYGGLQDNGVWWASSDYENDHSWQQYGKYPYQMLISGDGMQVQVDTRDNNTVYSGYQFGNYYRFDKKQQHEDYIQPSHDLGERPLRFNWQTPILLSSHNMDVLYLGSNKFHRSMQQGDNFKTLSSDLTQGGRKGDVPYGTLTSISESPFKFGLLYVGSDDGLVHISRDGGYSWTRISDALPQNLWVSRVIASLHNEATVYVTLNGYRFDDFNAYVYVSNDYGKTWKRIATDLPLEPVNVIREDTQNPDILYIGTDNGLYVSFDKGNSCMMLGNLPAVAVHDLVVHPRDNDLVVGTHGRSIYIADIQHLQQLTADVLAKNVHVFDVKSITYSSRWGKTWNKWITATQPKRTITIYASQAQTATLTVSLDSSTVVHTHTLQLNKGINYYDYDLGIDTNNENQFKQQLTDTQSKYEPYKNNNGLYYITPATYNIQIKTNSSTVETTLEVRESH